MTTAQDDALQLVIEELANTERELEELLQKQKYLLKRKRVLEQSIGQPQITQLTDLKEWERTDFKWSAEVEEKRASFFKLKEFRPLQLQTINATLCGKDSIVVVPTGGGKSLCYQLPALISKGMTLVVSPLVSLMEDQLMGLKKLGIDAAMLCAASSKEDIKEVQNAMSDAKRVGRMRLLYVTPEKLAKSKRFMNKLEKVYEMGLLARIAIDEVHCCSQWGHDFRPDYKFLGVLKRQFPNTPILGLTATATNDVIQDVTKMLGIANALIFRAPLNRSNLFYEVLPKPPSLTLAVDAISEMIRTRFKDQTGIIYCLTQKDAEEVSRELQTRGFQVGCYHANMDSKKRSLVHVLWTNEEIQIVVATIAFGMGIDKPNVRFIIHHSISKSVENYYQESGRAGRDGEPAHCILLLSFADLFRQSTMVFTERTGLDKLYAMVHYATDLSTCRRSLLAQCFGEIWESKQCEGMCDHCCSRHKGFSHTKDVTQYCKDVIKLLCHAKATNQRVTSLKLVEAWSGKGSTALRLSNIVPPKLPRSELERIIVHMLLNGYLREDFHFTPYSTISYIIPGSRADVLQSSGHSIEVELLVSEHATSKVRSSSINSARIKNLSQLPSCESVSKLSKSLGKAGLPNSSSSGNELNVKRPRTSAKEQKAVQDSSLNDGQCHSDIDTCLRKKRRVQFENKEDSDKSYSAKSLETNSKSVVVIDDDDNE